MLAPVSRHDHSTRRNLPRREGMLWVGFRLSSEHGFATAEVRAALERFVALVEQEAAASWDGQSSGAGQVDVSFEVEDLLAAAQMIRRIIARDFPGRDFWVSDRYETLFDRS